jgi:2-hydroxy-6-oxonona-2,4-dienedioate hydrolase
MNAAGGPPLPSGPTVLARLTKIDIPSLIIHGRDDRTTPLETSLQILAALPNSRALIFNHCGHWAQLEHAQEFNREVELFLETH